MQSSPCPSAPDNNMVKMLASSPPANLRAILLILGSACCFYFFSFVPTCSQAQAPAETSAKFIEQQCADCHDGKDGEGGFDIAALRDDLADPAVMQRWVRVFDRVASGEMPPPDESSLSETQRQSFLSATGSWLRGQQQKDFKTQGRVRGKRLTNLQLERTLHDLLGIDIPLAELMPEEQKSAGFTTVADGQPMSHFQLEQHLQVVDAALDEAIRRALGNGDEWKKHFEAKDIVRRNPNSRCREPEMLDQHAVTWSTNTTFYGRLPVTTARVGGWYRFAMEIKALKPPQDHGVWFTVHSGSCVSSAPRLDWVDAFEATEKPQVVTFETWIPGDEMLEVRPGDATLKQARFAGGQVGSGEGEPQNVPGIAIKWLEMERFHRGSDDDTLRKQLFGDLEIANSKTKPDKKNSLAPKVVVSRQPQSDAQQLMVAFASRAFRRPVNADEIATYVAYVHELLDEGADFVSAIRVGYRSLLCSPRFLYFQETPGKLDDYAIASRVSYLLWNRGPDAELLDLAQHNQLSDPQVLRQQVERMLHDPRGADFVKDFAAQWLDMDQIDFTTPDRRLYPGFDPVVQYSMLDETHAFLQEMLDKDLDVGQLIDSPGTFLNSRLARYYGIAGVDGDELRKVALKPDDHRGGLLTHGSIMKVTANGTTTSPVIRGVWVSERLLGEHIPPPPDSVPAIEPDIRGAKSIREMLEKHKSDLSCAVCHVKIDPPGYALENYDPSGRWRESYRTGKRDKSKDKTDSQIDTSYQMPNGSKFNDISEFKKLLISDRKPLASNLAEKLIVYGTGAEISFSDRQQVDEIVKNAEKSGYGFRSILQEVIASDVFLSK
jgi:hypothetical protein